MTSNTKLKVVIQKQAKAKLDKPKSKNGSLAYLLKNIKEFYRIPGNRDGGILRAILSEGHLANEDLVYVHRMATIARDELATSICKDMYYSTRGTRADVYASRYQYIW